MESRAEPAERAERSDQTEQASKKAHKQAQKQSDTVNAQKPSAQKPSDSRDSVSEVEPGSANGTIAAMRRIAKLKGGTLDSDSDPIFRCFAPIPEDFLECVRGLGIEMASG